MAKVKALVKKRSKQGKDIIGPDEYGGNFESTVGNGSLGLPSDGLTRPNVYLRCLLRTYMASAL